ncbi:MAG: polysaccharide deacetylase family protein [Ruminiclostridium sp.]
MKTRIILSALLMSAIFALGGCTCANNADNPADVNDNNGTTAINEGTEITDNNGEYDVSDDGMVTENAPEENKDGNDTFNDGVNENAVTDDGIVNGNELESPRVTDEVAYASSYIDSNKICWGLGKEHDELNRPLDAVKAEEKYKSLGGKFLTSGKNICLTFDEGYENGYTAKILDVLKEKGVKAVFFVTYDYCKSSPDLVRRMLDEGHIVGNHSTTHPSFPDISEEEIKKEVMTLHDYVKENFDYEMTLFRFPKGEFSSKAIKVLSDLGYESIFWSFAYMDWDVNSQPDKAEAYAKVTDSTHSGIYLLHAVSSTNAEIIGSVIDYWREKGYEVGSEV